MHYEDLMAIESFKLVVVVYKHNIIGEPGKFHYEISSIKQCEYVNTYLLIRLLKNPNKYLKKYFKNKKSECWYETKIETLDGYDKITVDSIVDVSDSNNELDRLH